jgi:uncharacterized membrane protein
MTPESDKSGCFGNVIKGFVNGIILGIILTPVAIVLHKTNPSQQEFKSFAEKEGFVIPAINRKDLGVASYYEIKGTFTGEQRAYLGVFHTFIRMPDIHRAESNN